MATPRKTTTRTKPEPAPETLPEGLIHLDEDEDHSEFEATAPLFAVGGKVYEARTEFSASDVLTYSKLARTKGIDAAVEWLMEAALGDEGYAAFIGYKYLKLETASKIISQVVERITGITVADPK
jgi:hypothetical protein